MHEITGQPTAGADGAPMPWPTSPPAGPTASTDPVEPPLTFTAGPGTLPPHFGVGTPPVVPSTDAGGQAGVARVGLARLIVPAALVAAAVAVLATFQTWLRIGSSERTSYEVVRAAERLDVVGGAGQSAFAVLWAFLPFAVALGVLAVALGWRRLAGALLLAAAVVEALFAGLVLRAPGLAGPGARAGLVASLALAVLAVFLLIVRPSRSSS